jgi:hypothetical protein
MDSQTYFKMNFKSIVTHKQLTEYTILDVELLGPRQGKVCELSPQCALVLLTGYRRGAATQISFPCATVLCSMRWQTFSALAQAISAKMMRSIAPARILATC